MAKVANDVKPLKAEIQNKANVNSLYKALAKGQTGRVEEVLASDVEWWFHGPHRCQHMMKVLTGDISGCSDFRFVPQSITGIGDYVIAEGWELKGGEAYWVHVWKLKDGLIVQFREYFNTWLTVTDIRPSSWEDGQEPRLRPSPMLWQSRLPRDLVTCSLPGILLAI